jgi:RecB family exonuclease
VIYPTSRAIRARIQDELKEDGILPKIITIGEFEKKALIVPNRIFIDQDERTLLLNQASEFSTFKNLHIDREFFTFLKNSKYLFSFFDELSVELVDIEKLASYDIYASYSEHIDILSTLLHKYKQLLKEKNYVDKITLPSLYKLNLSYLKAFEEIELYLEGYLNNFEFKFLFEIADELPLNIHINVNSFNTKMVQKFKEYDIELKNNHQYIINLSDKTIISEIKKESKSTIYSTYSTQNRILQVAYIKKKIYDFTNQGIDPKDIAVILPNGSFAETVDLFDDENNFNFAMGFSYQKSNLFQKFQAMYDYYTTRDIEGKYRLQRLDIDIEKLQISYQLWNKRHTKEELVKIFTDLVKNREEDEETKIYLEEFHLFSKLLPNLLHQPFHKLFHLFLNRLSKRSIDDTRGGKITVLEVLETRGVSFKAVIIVDFNEGIVPLTSQKDLFLSSELRFLAGLPTSTDRENLQKYYYQRVFDEADEVAISYVEDEQNQPSRFLDELDIPRESSIISNLDTILFTPHKQKKHYEALDLVLKYDFTKTKLSATALKTYLDCKRAYYFKYIKKLNQTEIPKEDNSDRVIGILLHEALKRVYEKKDAYFDEENLLFNIQSYLYQESEKSANLRFLVDIWIEKLKPFVQNEIKRFHDGYRVKYIEKKFDIKIDNLSLTGKIDRVDIKDNYLEVIDYKSGKIPKDTKKSLEKCSNFQLQFYHLLTSSEGEVLQSYYYDLNSANLIHEELFDQKLDLLYQKLELLKNIEHNFTMTDDMKKCIHCPYTKICNRIF